MSDYEGLQAVEYQQPGLEVGQSPAAVTPVEKGPYQYVKSDQNGDFDALQVDTRKNDFDALQLDTRKETTRNGKLCGLRKPFFWILVAISAIVLIAAGVGAGVGASMSHKKSKAVSPSQSSGSADSQTTSLSSATTTAPQVTLSPSVGSATSSPSASSSSDNASPTPFPSSGNLAVDCPALENSTYASTPAGSSTTYAFLVHCGANYVINPPAITGFNTTTLDACMDKCANYNQVLGGQPCVAVTFQGNLTEAESPLQRANCWLAGTTSGGVTSNNELLVSAELDSSSITGTS